MKRYLFLFNWHTLVIAILALAGSFVSLQLQVRIYIDFIFLGLFIAFPITFSLKEAARKKTNAIKYLSAFNTSMQSSLYYFENSKVERDKKVEFKNVLIKTSERLIEFLSGKTGDATAVQKASDAVFIFVQANKRQFKEGLSDKILSFQNRINENIVLLLAAKRHNTPWGVRLVTLFAIYVFVIFYPASLIGGKGVAAFWNVFAMTAFKSFILIWLYNVQMYLENPFDQDSPDGIRLKDFQFDGTISGYRGEKQWPQ
jgi:hypothetical protein